MQWAIVGGEIVASVFSFEVMANVSVNSAQVTVSATPSTSTFIVSFALLAVTLVPGGTLPYTGTSATKTAKRTAIEKRTHPCFKRRTVFRLDDDIIDLAPR
ncbi:MAG: hypothetical protein WAM97_11455 [Acidimicrobiales bacterium]